MKTIAQVVEIIKFSQLSSEQCWEMAVATDDADRGFGEDAEQCDDAYIDAMSSLEAGGPDCISEARAYLEQAEQLERDGGDSQHAQRALAALEELGAECDAEDSADTGAGRGK